MQLAHEGATRAHAGQADKVGRPYIEHPTAVAERLTTDDEQAVGFLHDVVEDIDITLAELRAMAFTVDQVLAVDAVMKRRGEMLEQSIARIVADPSGIALRVKRADVSHNGVPARLATVTDEDARARLQQKDGANTPSCSPCGSACTAACRGWKTFETCTFAPPSPRTGRGRRAC